MKPLTSAFILLPSAFGELAARLGFEPRQTDSESAVLPLHNRASDWVSSLVTLFGESSRGWKTGRTLALAVLFFLTITSIPVSAAETNDVLHQIETRIRSAILDLKPEAKLEAKTNYTAPHNIQISFEISYLPQKYLVHWGSMSGAWSTNVSEELGPSYKGFVLRVQLQDFGFANQAMTPQTLREPYWQTFIDVTALSGAKNQLYWSFSYGAQTDRELLKNIRSVIRSFGDSSGKPTAPPK